VAADLHVTHRYRPAVIRLDVAVDAAARDVERGGLLSLYVAVYRRGLEVDGRGALGLDVAANCGVGRLVGGAGVYQHVAAYRAAFADDSGARGEHQVAVDGHVVKGIAGVLGNRHVVIERLVRHDAAAGTG